MRFGSLFSGIGGLDLGLERAGMECAWQVEIDEWCRRVLARHWPDVPRWDDAGTFPCWSAPGWWTDDGWPLVDLICGGFPCQDVSDAHTNGARRSLQGDKSGLWRHFHRIVEALSPRWVLIENVGAWRRWVPEVRTDLAALGYASLPVELRAGSFGAPHKRPRIFVVADAYGQGESLRALYEEVARLSPVPGRGGDWRTPPPGGLRMGDGLSDEMDRLRGLGNAVVPQVAAWIGRRLMEQQP